MYAHTNKYICVCEKNYYCNEINKKVDFMNPPMSAYFIYKKIY